MHKVTQRQPNAQVHTQDTNPVNTTPLPETCNQRTHSQTSKDRHTDGEAVTQRQKEKRIGVSSHDVPDSQVQECRRPNPRQLWDPGPGGWHPQRRGQQSPPLRPQLGSEPLPCLFSSQGRTKVRGHSTSPSLFSQLWAPGQAPAVPHAGRHHSRRQGWGLGVGVMWAGSHLARGLTWAHGGARSLLEGLALTEGSSVERGGVGAGPCALLPAAATAVGAGRPLCPAGPSAVHCRGSRCHPIGLALWPHGPPSPISPPLASLLLRLGLPSWTPPACGARHSDTSRQAWLQPSAPEGTLKVMVCSRPPCNMAKSREG